MRVSPISESANRESINLESPIAQILFSLVRMEVAGPRAAGVATAFVYTQEWKGRQAAFLVANRHAVTEVETGRLYFTRSQADQPVLGQHVRLELGQFGSMWHPHPNPGVDLAITPLGPILHQLEAAGKSVFNRALNESLIPPRSDALGVDAVEDLIVMGFPAELHDPAHLLPIVMRGVTATPFSIDFAGQPRFLVQAPVFAGMSGSPVLAVRSAHQATPQGIVRGSQVTLLGVLSDVAVRQDRLPAATVPIPVAPQGVLATANWAPFGLALRSWAIHEIVDDLLNKIEVADPDAPATHPGGPPAVEEPLRGTST